MEIGKGDPFRPLRDGIAAKARKGEDEVPEDEGLQERLVNEDEIDSLAGSGARRPKGDGAIRLPEI